MSSSRKLLSDQVDEREIAVILRELARTQSIEGDVVEFGCYVGTTSVFLARELAIQGRKKLYLYDSFNGLPPKTIEDSSPAGEQFKTGELLATKKELIKNIRQANVPMPIVKKAWFSELTSDDVPDKISFAYLDGDYYLSILDPLKLIWPKLQPGAIVVIDDYTNEALPGAAKAVNEWAKRYNLKVRNEASLGFFQI